SINVAEDVASPTAVASGGTLDCNTTSLILNGSGSSSGPGFSYQWNTSNGNIVSGANTLNATVDAPGAYTLTVTNAANGCFSTVNVNVTQNIALPTA
ncbi:MAG: hypothetical protein KDC43_22660, partial [Saprospiraceae bacterium]|nr:hypothetical protein [Saprospiraceae bacterium]